MSTDPKSKPKFLLHICCAPCSTQVVRLLQDDFAVTGYYYNPSIYPEREYNLRSAEALRYAAQMRIPLILAPYDPTEWDELAKGHEDDPEGGERCEICFRMRLERTAKLAAEHGFRRFGTTLTVSPHKNAECINRIGRELAEEHGIEWHEADFKKHGGFKESVRLSKEAGLYRQDYCGCIFSLRERDRRKAAQAP